MHSIENLDGMKVYRVTEMQPYARVLPKPGDKPTPARPLDKAVDLVHLNDISEFYGIDKADLWPLVIGNIIGRRVNYNSGETVRTDMSYVHWEPSHDDYGNIHMDREIRYRDEMVETDDGMYVRHSELLKYAKQHGWKRGAGLPEHQVAAQQAMAGEDLKEILGGILKLVERQGEMIETLAKRPAR